MAIKAKTFSTGFLLLTAVFLLPAPVINYVVDYHRVLGNDYVMAYPAIKQNIMYLKTSHLLNEGKDINNVIFGSSRVRHGFEASSISTFYPGEWYKMSQIGGITAEHLHTLKVLIKNKHQLDHVILTLDEFSVQLDPDVVAHYYEKRKYPLDWFDSVTFYLSYLFKMPGKKELNALTGKVKLSEQNFVLNNEGTYTTITGENLARHNEYIYSLLPYPKRSYKKLAVQPYLYIDSVINDVIEFKKLCAEHNIRLSILITPRHYKSIIAKNHPEIIKFKKLLARHTDYFDFSVLDRQPLDNTYWLETSHFYADLGDEVMRIIKQGGNKPGAFGAFVTRDNINEHLTVSYTNLVSSLPSLMQADKNIYLGAGLREKGYEKIYDSIGR